MAFELPQLPYAYDALEPHIDARTMEIHHGKHHAGYTAKLNAAIEGTDMAGKSIEALCTGSRYSRGPGHGGGTDNPCPPDFDEDGTVTVSDALILLSDFGCLSNCSSDLTGDGAVTTSDMLVFLSAFGDICE